MDEGERAHRRAGRHRLRQTLRSGARAVVASFSCVQLAACAAAPSSDAPPQRAPTAIVSLPERADEPFRLTDPRTGIWADVSLVGATGARGAASGNDRIYRGATADGGDVLHRPRAHGTEDWIGLPREPEGAEVRYAIALGPGVAGLRLVARSLELLDRRGAPRLRVSPPFVVGADGVRHDATLAVEGCELDASPVAPWGRAPTRAGSDRCTVVVGWRGQPVAYPAILDPVWTTTDELGDTRQRHSATRLSDGRVIVVGGNSLIGAELFDPATATWAATGAPPYADREWAGLVRLVDGRVLLAGGDDGFDWSSSATYDPATGAWTPVADLAVGRRALTATLLADGSVLVAGGEHGSTAYGTAERFDPASDTWTAVPDMSDARSRHTASVLADGRVLVAGGYVLNGSLASAEIFDPVAGGWTPVASMASARGYHTATTLADGRVMVTGGYDGGDVATTEVFDPSSGAWVLAAPLPEARSWHTASMLPSGRVLVAGGCIDATGCSVTPSVDTFDPATLTWLATPPLLLGRIWHAQTPLLDGRVLVTGGNGGVTLSEVEIFSSLADGATCTVSGECASGACADGFCCDVACDGPCLACSAAKTGGQDGVCAPVPAGEDPDAECLDSGAAACAENGWCDGAGSCQLYASASGCAPEPCTGPADCASGFCDPDDSICCNEACTGLCEACTVAKKGGGKEGECGPIEGKSDPDDECSADPTEDDCGKITLCDGEGACASATTLCSPFACAAGGCLEACAVDAECAPGFRCDGAACVASASSCKDQQTALDSSGIETSCAPYLCRAGACLEQCGSVDDCVAPSLCDTTGACVAAPAKATSDDGCACATAVGGERASDGPGSVALWAAAAVSAFARRRRRR